MSTRLKVGLGLVLAGLIAMPGLDIMSGNQALATQAGKRKQEAGKLKFEVYQDAAKEYRWRLKAANGEILATGGQGYKSKESCEHGIEVIKTEVATDKLTFEVYEDNAGQHRWRLKAANGQIIAASSEGYKAKSDCQHAIDLLKRGAARAEVKEEI
jgi:uncharacterized protein YegP (UPF0339 family)